MAFVPQVGLLQMAANRSSRRCWGPAYGNPPLRQVLARRFAPRCGTRGLDGRMPGFIPYCGVRVTAQQGTRTPPITGRKECPGQARCRHPEHFPRGGAGTLHINFMPGTRQSNPRVPQRAPAGPISYGKARGRARTCLSGRLPCTGHRPRGPAVCPALCGVTRREGSCGRACRDRPSSRASA